MLNDKEICILKKLLNKEDITIKSIAKEFGISTRSVRYYINNISLVLTILNKEKITLKNSCLSLNEDINLTDILNSIREKLYISKENRKRIVELILLFDETGLNLAKLAEELKVSRGTVKNDFDEIKRGKLGKIYIAGKGYKYSGEDREQFLGKMEILEQLFREIKETNNTLTRKMLENYLNKYINNAYLKSTEKFLKELYESLKLKNINQIYQKLKIYLLLLIYYNEDCKIPNIDIYEMKIDYEKIEKIYRKIFTDKKPFEKMEIKLSKILDLTRGLSVNNLDNEGLSGWIDDSFIIKKMIMKVSEVLKEDLTGDTQLYDYLLYHLKPCIYRIKNNIRISEDIYKDLVETEPYIINAVKKSIKESEEIFQLKFTDIEILLLAFHFKAAIERKHYIPNKKVILVCKLGYGTSKILESGLKSRYNIEILDTAGEHDLGEILKRYPFADAILTTVNTDLKTNIPKIKISPSLTDGDIKKLGEIGIYNQQKKIFLSELIEIIKNNSLKMDEDKIVTEIKRRYPEIIFEDYGKAKMSVLLKEIKEENFIIIEEKKDWRAALNIMGKIFEKNDVASMDYTSDIIKTVEKVGPYFILENEIAVPHGGLFREVNKSGVVFIIFRNKVEFNKNKKANIFFGIASKDKNYYSDLLGEVLMLSNKESIVHKINEITNYNDWKTFLQSVN